MTSILNPMVTQECTDPGAFRRETAEACTGAALLSPACRDTIVRSAATHGAQCMRMPIFDGGPPFQAYVCRGADRASGLLGGQCDQPATRVAPSAVAPSTSSSGVAPVELGALGTAGLLGAVVAGRRGMLGDTVTGLIGNEAASKHAFVRSEVQHWRKCAVNPFACVDIEHFQLDEPVDANELVEFKQHLRSAQAEYAALPPDVLLSPQTDIADRFRTNVTNLARTSKTNTIEKLPLVMERRVRGTANMKLQDFGLEKFAVYEGAHVAP